MVSSNVFQKDQFDAAAREAMALAKKHKPEGSHVTVVEGLIEGVHPLINNIVERTFRVASSDDVMGCIHVSKTIQPLYVSSCCPDRVYCRKCWDEFNPDGDAYVFQRVFKCDTCGRDDEDLSLTRFVFVYDVFTIWGLCCEECAEEMFPLTPDAYEDYKRNNPGAY